MVMNRAVCLVVVWLAVVSPAAAQVPLPKPMIDDMKNLSQVAVGTDGKVYLSVQGFTEANNDGKILVLKNGKTEPFATGITKPGGLVAWQKWLFVADGRGIVRVDNKGKVEVIAANDRFPMPPKYLTALAVDEQ